MQPSTFIIVLDILIVLAYPGNVMSSVGGVSEVLRRRTQSVFAPSESHILVDGDRSPILAGALRSVQISVQRHCENRKDPFREIPYVNKSCFTTTTIA